ncbi:MAG: HepT-like ribonuclease domain-containing protein [Candidatus Promineifilaceae bacterium]
MDEALRDRSYVQFRDDWEKQLVAERLLEIIGEAASHISPGIKARNDQIPWPQIVAMRNLVSHEYFRVDPQAVWRTAIHAVPTLRQQVQQIVVADGLE